MSAKHTPGGSECRPLFEKLSEYLDGELDASVCAFMETHLEDCPPCRQFLESLRRTVGLLRRLPVGSRLPEEARHEVVEAYARLKKEADG